MLSPHARVAATKIGAILRASPPGTPAQVLHRHSCAKPYQLVVLFTLSVANVDFEQNREIIPELRSENIAMFQCIRRAIWPLQLD
jgi:hypothetical protein